MARLIGAPVAVELNPVVGGLPVVELVDDSPCEVEFVAKSRKAGGSGARLDRSFEVIVWFE